MLAPWKERDDKPQQHTKKQRYHFASDRGPYSQSYNFSSSHAQMWELDHKEGWALKKYCLWSVVLEKTLESSLDCREIKPVNPKGNQPRIFPGRTDVKVEAPILWAPDVKSWLKTLMLKKNEGKSRRGWQGWHGWIASLIQWTWIWENCRR